MRQYLDLLDHVIKTGTEKKDRTGTGTISVFGYQMRFNLEEGFPLLTTKKLHLKSIIHELLWFISGDTNTKYLNDNGVKIWNEWADKDGNLGPVYGYQWRSWPADGGRKIDQLDNLIASVKKSPDSRRHIVCAWNVGELGPVSTPACRRGHGLLRPLSVALSRCRLLPRPASLVPDRRDRADFCVRRGDGELPGFGTAAAAISSES